MTHDPFAVSNYPLETLPEVGESRRADFETADFGPIWIEHMGGTDKASRHVRNASGRERFGFLEPSRLGPIKPGAPVDLSPENLGIIAHAQKPTRSEELSRRLGIVTLLAHIDGQMPKDLHRALALVLGVDKRVQSRQEASGRAQVRGAQLARGDSETQAVKAAQSRFGGSNGKVWAETDLPVYAGLMRASRDDLPLSAYPHAADPWFDNGVAERVGQEMLKSARKGPLPVAQKWDLLNLVEGYQRRRARLPNVVLTALDHALGLVDSAGLPVEHGKPLQAVVKGGEHYSGVPLAGIAKRRAFMQCARVQAGLLNEDDIDADLTSPATRAEWESLAIFQTAVAHLKR